MASPNQRQAYWNKSKLIGPSFPNFKHLAYTPLKYSKPDMGLALKGAYIDVGPDIDYLFEEFENSFKCWITLKIRYEPVNPSDESHKGFDAYLASLLTRIFKKFGIVSGWGNFYSFEIKRTNPQALNLSISRSLFDYILQNFNSTT